MRPEHREAIEEAVGYGPGDAYIALWDELAELKRDRRSAARSLTQPTLKGEARASVQKRADYLQETFISTLISILPFERPPLANLKFQDNDRRGETIDLTVLPDGPRLWTARAVHGPTRPQPLTSSKPWSADCVTRVTFADEAIRGSNLGADRHARSTDSNPLCSTAHERRTHHLETFTDASAPSPTTLG
jgi:hypothetical protein